MKQVVQLMQKSVAEEQRMPVSEDLLNGLHGH
jgi:hypothetical protein